MTSRISRSSVYSILANSTAVSRGAMFTLFANKLGVSKLGTYIILKGDGTQPRRTVVEVNWIAVDTRDEWRLVSGFCYFYDNTQFSEMEWSEGSGQPNLLTPGSFGSSSEYGGVYKRENATDGNTATAFSFVGSRNFWMTDRLPGDKSLDFIRLLPNTTSANQFPRELIVQKKVDNEWVSYGDVSFGATAPTSGVWKEAAVTKLLPPAISVADPHRHWRIVIVACAQGHQYLLARRLKLFNELDEDIGLSPGKTVTFTEQQGTTYAAEHLFEENADQWASNGVQKSHFIAIDLGVGNAQRVTHYDFTVTGNATAPTGWRIECSDDGTNWKIADERLFQTWTANETKSFTIAA